MKRNGLFMNGFMRLAAYALIVVFVNKAFAREVNDVSSITEAMTFKQTVVSRFKEFTQSQKWADVPKLLEGLDAESSTRRVAAGTLVGLGISEMDVQEGEYSLAFGEEKARLSILDFKASGLAHIFVCWSVGDKTNPVYWMSQGYESVVDATGTDAEEFLKKHILGTSSGKVVRGGVKTRRGDKILGQFSKREYQSAFKEGWFFFIDDKAMANWSHPARYVFLREDLSAALVWYCNEPISLTVSGALEAEPLPIVVNSSTLNFSSEANVINQVRKAVKNAVSQGTNAIGFSGDASRSYAVLISGGYNIHNNHTRYWGDTAAMYSTLTKKYGIPKANIKVCMSDGTSSAADLSSGSTKFYYGSDGTTKIYCKDQSHTCFTDNSSPLDLDGDGLADVGYDARKSTIQNVFNSMASSLSADDQLFVFVTDHGSYDEAYGTYSVCLWNEEEMSPSEFATLTANIVCPVAFAMEFCYSGAFIDKLKMQSNRVIATAGGKETTSAFEGTNLYYINPWVFAFVTATRGAQPLIGVTPWNDANNEVNASAIDVDGNGRVSMKEAWSYAYSFCKTTMGLNETPLLGESPSGLGNKFFVLKQNSSPTEPAEEKTVVLNVLGTMEGTCELQGKGEPWKLAEAKPSWMKACSLTDENGSVSVLTHNVNIAMNGILNLKISAYENTGTTENSCVLSIYNKTTDRIEYKINVRQKSATSTYIVTLDRQSGSGGTASVTATYGSAMPSITVPTRSGYTFGGYYTGTNGSGTQYYTATGASARNWDKTSATTLYAKWTANTYSVSYTMNGGTKGTSSPTSGTYDTAFKVSAPTKSGSTFAGWTVSSGLNTGTAKYGTSSSSQATSITSASQKCLNGATGDVWFKNLTPGANGSVTLTANWTSTPATTYTVTYSPGSYASGSSQTATKKKDETLTLKGETFTRTGYTQTGWSKNSGGSTRDYALGASYTANAAITLYPCWTANTYSVSYTMNGGTKGTSSPTSGTYDTAFKVSAPTKSGSTFAGWTVSSGLNTGTAKYGTSSSSQATSITSASQKCLNGAAGDVWFKNLTPNANGSVTLTANWTDPSTAPSNDNFSSPVTISGASGSKTGSNTGATLETSEPKPSAQSNSGASVWYKWTAPSSGTVTFDTVGSGFDTVLGIYKGTSVSALTEISSNDDIESGNTKSRVTFSASSGTTYRIAIYGYNGGNGSYTLNWSLAAQTTITISFVANGGTSCANQEYTVGNVYGSLPTTSKTGYTFDGWYMSSAFTTKVTTSSTVSASVSTLYAKWTANTYSVSYTMNGGTKGTSSPTSGTYDTALKVSAPTKSGSTFAGWTVSSGLNTSTAKYGTSSSSQATSITSSSQKCLNGATGDVWFKNLTPSASGSVTLTANWTSTPEPTYTVTYSPGSYCSGSQQTATKTKDETLTLKGAIFTRTGYVQTGWSKNSGGSTKDYALGASYTANAAITLYPYWTANTYKIRFNANGGTGTMSDLVMTYDVATSLPSNRFKKKGYKFIGWGTSTTENVRYANGVSVRNLSATQGAIIILYAVWVETGKPDCALHDIPNYGTVSWSYKSGSYNGYAMDEVGMIAGTFSLAVRKPLNPDGDAPLRATLTFVSLATGKKMKLVGNIYHETGEGDGDLAGLTFGADAVGGTVAKVGTLEGGADAVKAKNASSLAVLGKFTGKSYVVALGAANVDAYAQGGYSTLTITMAAKGKAKVSGVLADGTKVTASAQMTVGDTYCCVPVIYSKKSKFGFVAWFDKNTRELVGVTALTPWKNTVKPSFTMNWEVVGFGAKSKLAAGTQTFELDDVKLLGLVPGAIAQTPFDIPLKVSGTKWDAGKAAKVAYKGGKLTIAGGNVSGLKLTYTAKTGLFKGSLTVYAVKGGKLAKNKFNVFGAVTGGIGYGTAVLKGKGSAASLIATNESILLRRNREASLTETRDIAEKVQLWEGGPYWADRNIGADNPWDYGLYFCWGDTTGYRPSGTTFSFSFDSSNCLTDNKNIAVLQSEGWIVSKGGAYVLAPAHDAAQAQWGGDWRMPTYQELSDLNNKCDWTWTTQNGVNGYVVRGRGAYASNSIFLPAAGFGSQTSLSRAGSHGYYWSSVPYSDSSDAYVLGFSSGGCSIYYYYRDIGQSVRPVQEDTN